MRSATKVSRLIGYFLPAWRFQLVGWVAAARIRIHYKQSFPRGGPTGV